MADGTRGLNPDSLIKKEHDEYGYKFLPNHFLFHQVKFIFEYYSIIEYYLN